MNSATFFFIRINRKYERIELSGLVYVESCRGYLKLITDTGSRMVHTSMLTLQQVLPDNRFCRIHRSYLIAINRVQNFDKDHVTLYNNNGEKIRLPIGQDRYKHALHEKVTIIGETPLKAETVTA